IVVAGDVAYVLLGALPRDFSGADAPSRLVGIDSKTDSVVSTTVLDGAFDCAGLALSPDDTTLAVLCSGKRIVPTAPSDLTGSGGVLVDVSATPTIVRRVDASDLGDGPVGFFAAFVSKTALLVETFGYDDPVSGAHRDDTIVELDLSTGSSDVV